MLITNNNIELRNLQEQVQKNKEDIAKHYEIDRTLSNFGIKIVGTVTDVNDLPDPLYYEGEYGDGYAVGQPGNYTYYLFTRPDPNQGIDTNYWLDVGELGIQGPQGPQGPQGEQGPKGYSTKWFTSGADAVDNGKPGDLWLDTNGNVYVYSDSLGQWVLTANIKGPQGIQGIRGPQGPQGEIGPQGPKGDTGDVGGFINIAGILNNESSLPLPTDLNNLNVAYLVGTASPYELYIQVGSTSQDAIWENMGPLNVATYVTVNGKFQNIWDADSKLDKVTTSQILYGTNYKGETTTWKFGGEAKAHTLMYRSGDGTASIADPIQPLNIANKKWVEDNFKIYKHLIEIRFTGGVVYITALNRTATAVETLSEIADIINNKEALRIFDAAGTPQVIYEDATAAYESNRLTFRGLGMGSSNDINISFAVIESFVASIIDTVKVI